MITRTDMINNARRYTNISSWSPLRDTHVFNPADHTFDSCFVLADHVAQTPNQGAPHITHSPTVMEEMTQ